jgi:hypothetical protein
MRHDAYDRAIVADTPDAMINMGSSEYKPGAIEGKEGSRCSTAGPDRRGMHRSRRRLSYDGAPGAAVAQRPVKEPLMSERDDTLLKATAEADELFNTMSQIVSRRVESGERSLDVVEIAKEAGLEVDDRIIEELQIPRVIPAIRFLPWYEWYPWRPLWCWWWRYRYPWYRCCPYWWHRCHWW